MKKIVSFFSSFVLFMIISSTSAYADIDFGNSVTDTTIVSATSTSLTTTDLNYENQTDYSSESSLDESTENIDEEANNELAVVYDGENIESTSTIETTIPISNDVLNNSKSSKKFNVIPYAICFICGFLVSTVICFLVFSNFYKNIEQKNIENLMKIKTEISNKKSGK